MNTHLIFVPPQKGVSPPLPPRGIDGRKGGGGENGIPCIQIVAPFHSAVLVPTFRRSRIDSIKKDWQKSKCYTGRCSRVCCRISLRAVSRLQRPSVSHWGPSPFYSFEMRIQTLLLRRLRRCPKGRAHSQLNPRQTKLKSKMGELKCGLSSSPLHYNEQHASHVVQHVPHIR